MSTINQEQASLDKRTARVLDLSFTNDEKVSNLTISLTEIFYEGMKGTASRWREIGRRESISHFPVTQHELASALGYLKISNPELFQEAS